MAKNPNRLWSRRSGVAALTAGSVLVGSCMMVGGLRRNADRVTCDQGSIEIELTGTMQSVLDIYGEAGSQLGYMALKRSETELSVALQDIAKYGKLTMNKLEYSRPEDISSGLEYAGRFNGTYWAVDADTTTDTVQITGTCN